MSTDYKEIGLKAGIEIHQQIEGSKLFCRCRTEIRKDKPDFKIYRRLRASAGETGEVDKAAKHEQSKQKSFEYLGYEDINCLVETDSEPPKEVSSDALYAAIQVSKMLNMKIADKIIFMRKTVVDGSNVSGFQRTALIGRDGYIEVDGKKFSIESICLEEEACQVIERGKDKDVYNLSRLGIPLLEIATGPDIRTPLECKAVASKLGMILRSTGMCKRGIGSIRQDVNLSIKGGERIEIKGFQDLRSIPKVMENEIIRQQKEMKNGKKVEKHVRKAEPDFSTSYLRPMPGASRMYPETDVPIIDISKIEVVIPKTIEEQEEELVKKFKISNQQATEVIKNNFDLPTLAKKYNNISPSNLVSSAFEFPKEAKKRFDLDINPTEARFSDVYVNWNAGKITYSDAQEVFVMIQKGEKVDYSKFKKLDDKELEKAVIEAIKKDSNAPIGALMGQIMAKYKGKVEGKKVMEFLKKHKK